MAQYSFPDARLTPRLRQLGLRPWWIGWYVDWNDCWLGVYWTWKVARYDTPRGVVWRELHLYICLVPCVPLHVVIGQMTKET